MRTMLRSKALLVLAFGLLLAVPAIALADNLVNDLASNEHGSRTITTNGTTAGTTTVGYQITQTGAGNDGQAGCNAADTSPATVKFDSLPAGVTASVSQLSFNYCGNPDKDVTFSSTTPGTYTITPTVLDSGTGTYTTTNATFDLVVQGTGTSLNNVSGSGTTGLSNGTLSATLVWNGNNLGGKTVSFAIDKAKNGTFTTVGSATTDNTTGVATLSNVSLAGLAPGQYPLRATFAGDDNYAGATQTGTLTVNPSNHAPTVSTDALNVSGPEGSQLTNSGAFADQDTGQTLAISKKSGVGTVTPGANGAWSWSYTPTDNGSGTVEVEVSDGNGGTAVDSFTWTATNVAPTATFTSPDVDEGSNISLSLTSPHDPSSADTTAGFTYAFDCNTDDATGYSAFSSTSTASCPTTDNGTRNVGAKIKDKDGDVSTYTDSVTISNVAPTISSVTNDGPINEGQSATITVTASDPAGANDPLSYSFDCNGDGDYTDADDKGPQAADNATCSYNDNGTPTVNVRVTDGDGGSNTDSTVVTVNNVPPTISSVTNTSGAIDEGQSATISVSASDPAGANDPLSYEFDCKNDGTYEVGPQSGNTNSCSYNDDGIYTVKVRVSDGDGGSTTDTTTVTVNNVAPSVTGLSNQSATEGTAKSFNLGSFTDPGDDGDWTVSVDWGDNSTPDTFTKAAAGSLGTRSHTYADEGTGSYTVTVTVTEAGSGTPPNGFASFTATVTNADPVVNAPTLTDPNGGVSCLGGNTVNLSSSFTDAGSLDTHSATIDWGDGSNPTTGTVNSATRTVTGQHTYSGLGPYTIKVTVTDNDGGSGNKSSTNALSFHYNIGTKLLSPVNDTSISGTSPSLFKVGSTIPLKVNITDCNGVGVAGLSPTIKMMLTSSSTPLAGEDEGISTQPNDSNFVMRGDGYGQYIYNLASKSLPDSSATYKAQITVNGYTVTTQNYFGLKAK